MNHQVVTDYTSVNTENSSVCVYVRARPPDPSWTLEDDDASVEEDKFQNPLQATLAGLSPKGASGGLSSAPHATSSAFISNFPDNPKKICIKDPAAQRSSKHHGEIYFSFDRVFWTECSQEEVFQAVAKPQVENIMNGFNGCCFAYGQTGSGKTYSMFGEGAGNSRGMIPRCMEEVFTQLERRSKDKEVAVVVSFLEIYCDRVRDLGEAYMSQGERAVHGLKTTSDVYQKMKLSRAESFLPRNKAGTWGAGNHASTGANGGVWDSYLSMDLKIHEDVQGNVFVKDLSLIPVTTLQEVLEIISLGLKVRATHETQMNQVSSRSHTVFTVTVVQRDPFTDQAMTGMLNLVDLAGSERLKKSASEGQRKTEALHINSSLTALGKVVMALDPSSGLTHIPYRDSKLTRLLQNSLGGNSFTVVLATVHPIARFSDECLSTLQFANRCRSVHNHPRVNKLGDGAVGDQRKLKKMQDEIQALRLRLEHGGGVGGGLGGAGGDPNARVLAVLMQMGLEGASQLPDGSIRLPDGRIVGNFGLDGEGRDGDGSEAGGGAGGGGGGLGRASYASGVLKGVSPSVRAMVEGLEGEVRRLKVKLQERKNDLTGLQDQLDAVRATSAEGQKEARRRENDLAQKLAVAKSQLGMVEAAAERTKDEQLAAVLTGSHELLRRQRRTLLKITGRADTDGPEHSNARAKEAKEARERRNEVARHEQSFRALKFSKEVETENLKQKCEQATQEEAKGRAMTEAKLEKWVTRRNREVREFSVELLLLHDHALSLRRTLHSAGLGPPPLCESSSPAAALDTEATTGEALSSSTTAAPAAAATANPVPPHSSKSTPALLLQSASLPRLSRLLQARGEQSLNNFLLESRPSEAADLDERNATGLGAAPAAPRARPRSAGVGRRTTTPGARASIPGAAAGFLGLTRRLDSGVKGGGHRRAGRTQRPTSAPGRHPCGNGGGESWAPEGHCLARRVEGGGGGWEGRGARALAGWNAQDLIGRDAGELSRDGLVRLIGTLRESLAGCEGKWGEDGDTEQQLRRKCQVGKPARGAAAVPFKSHAGGEGTADGPEEGHAEMQTRLREQARRYNDLRVAYKSLCRRLDKYRSLGGARTMRACSSGGGEKSGIAKLSPRYGRETSGANLLAAGRGTPEIQNPGKRRAQTAGGVAPRRFPEV